jgi:GDP-L-fucose synthase
MKIAVLGSNGFIGNHLIKFLSKKFDVIPITRESLDLYNYIDVKHFLSKNYFDYILNTAVSYTSDQLLSDTKNNLSIFMNFYNNSSKFGKFVHYGSGAEFDRTTNIENARETDIFVKLPEDSYGYGHNIMSRLCYEKDNFMTLRIFGCFGANEKHTRLIPKLLSNNDVFKLSNDRFFDYISIQDLCIITEFVIKNDLDIIDINCVYSEKNKLSHFLKTFVSIHGIKNQIIIDSESEFNYTGDSFRIDKLNINLLGLNFGIQNYFT